MYIFLTIWMLSTACVGVNSARSSKRFCDTSKHNSFVALCYPYDPPGLVCFPNVPLRLS